MGTPIPVSEVLFEEALALHGRVESLEYLAKRKNSLERDSGAAKHNVERPITSETSSDDLRELYKCLNQLDRAAICLSGLFMSY